MIKKIVFVLATTAMVYGCATFVKSKTADEPVYLEQPYFSFKGLNPRSIAQEQPADAKALEKAEKCKALRQVTYTYNGKPYKKYILDDDAALNCPAIQAFKKDMPWTVDKLQWSDQDEKDFGSFVKAIGNSKCNNLDQCLSRETNPLRDELDMFNLYYSDCADLPYYLRAYFAYKKHLPFAYVTGFSPAPLTPRQLENNAKTREAILAKEGEPGAAKFDKMMNDSRYPQNGNVPKYRYAVATTASGRNFVTVGRNINDGVSTGTYRMLDGDFYSPKINSASVKPGTAIYGTKGHAAIVYDVKPNGDILVIDAHPGNSITHNGWIQEEFVLDKPEKGGMFKNWRPVRVVDGKIIFAKDEEIADFSLEQYDSNNFTLGGKKLGLREWVNVKLSGGTYKFDPLDEMKTKTEQLCANFVFRVGDVQKAIDNGVSKNSISVYPNNIFGADGDWETYSTPSSDLRRRADTLSLIELAKESIQRVNSKDPMVSYKGTNLKADLANAFTSAAKACKVTYKNSVGAPVTLDLVQLSKRVGLFAFDPYMCPEARWGASGAEYATCADTPAKKEIYKLTQFLRNNNIKDPSAIHGYTLETLRQLDATKKGINNPAVYNYDVAAGILAL